MKTDAEFPLRLSNERRRNLRGELCRRRQRRTWEVHIALTILSERCLLEKKSRDTLAIGFLNVEQGKEETAIILFFFDLLVD